MSRKNNISKRKILPDPKFNSLTIAKFINYTMYSGKKSIAENIIYKAFEKIQLILKKDQINIFKLALKNVSPSVEVKSRRVGGATYQVPIEIRSDRQLSLAMRWIISAARKRKEKHMINKIASEIIDASENRGAAFKKREDTHKMAEANKAFSHFKW